MRTLSRAAGRTSGHRSALGMPVSTRSPAVAAGSRARVGRSSVPWSAARVAAAMPGASSRNDNACATEPPYVSASTRTVGMPSAASSVARVTRWWSARRAGRTPDRDHVRTRLDAVGRTARPRREVRRRRGRSTSERRRAYRTDLCRAGVPPSVQLAFEGVQGRVGGARPLGEGRLELGELRVAGTTRTMPSWCRRRSDSSSPWAAIPTTCTPADRSWATAVRSRPRRSPETSATVPRPPPPSRRGRADPRSGAMLLARGLEEGRDPAVPAVAERREDMRHEVPWPGTGTRVNRDCLSTAAMISATLSRGTGS